MNIYMNDCQRAKFYLHILDTDFIEEKTGISKTTQSKLKKADKNMEWGTIEKIIKLSEGPWLSVNILINDKSKFGAQFILKESFTQEWTNHLVFNVKTQIDLRNLGYFIAHNKLNPGMVRRILEFNIKSINPLIPNLNNRSEEFNIQVFNCFQNGKDYNRELHRANFSIVLEDCFDEDYYISNAETAAECEYLKEGDEIINLNLKYSDENRQSDVLANLLMIRFQKYFERYENMAPKYCSNEDFIDDHIYGDEYLYELRMVCIDPKVVFSKLKNELIQFGFQEQNNKFVYDLKPHLTQRYE